MERGSSVRGHSGDVENVPEPGASTGASDPAGGNGSHHALLRSPTAKPGVRADRDARRRRRLDQSEAGPR